MKPAGLLIGLIVAFSSHLVADTNLHIIDVGLNGYFGVPTAIRIMVRNPTSQIQSEQLKVVVATLVGPDSTVTTDVQLNGGEERLVELPILLPQPTVKVIAEAAIAGNVVAQDTYDTTLRSSTLILLMCNAQKVCETAQSQIAFSGSVEERADKNRGLVFEVANDFRDHDWAYSAAAGVVLATPVSQLNLAQRKALEGYLRLGGRLVILEHEIEDPSFLAVYRREPSQKGRRVGKGTLYYISGMSANVLGGVFTGASLKEFLGQQNMGWGVASGGWLKTRFATSFNFPRLRWILLWLSAYILVIGVVNFFILRRLRRLEYGWISISGLAIVFATGFYFSSASKRPNEFRLDNLATYYMDSESPLAAADYELRLSAPRRQVVDVSVADSAVFVNANYVDREPTSQIWAQMNRQAVRANEAYDIRLGPPRKTELRMLKWSFRDLNLKGLREFPNTVHFVSPTRLRNDTGQHFKEAIYIDNGAEVLYRLPELPPGGEVSLDAITPEPIGSKNTKPWVPVDQGKMTLAQLALARALPFSTRVFAGLSDGPAIRVDLTISHQENVHALVLVSMEHP